MIKMVGEEKRGSYVKSIFLVSMLFLVVLSLFCLVSLKEVKADFSSGNSSYNLTDVSYPPESFLKGWVNLSLDEEPTSSKLKFIVSGIEGDSEEENEEEMELIDVLEKNDDLERGSEKDYWCDFKGCQPSYTASNDESGKSFNLNHSEEKIFGLKIDENLEEIKDISFDLESDAEDSCVNQINVNFFDYDSLELGNNKEGEDYCDKSWGCFESGSDYEEGFIRDRQFCQRISLEEAPAYKIGAWLNIEESDDERVFMFLRDVDNGDIVSGAYCEIEKSDVPSSGGEVGCDIDFSLQEEKEYYVCIIKTDSKGLSEDPGGASGAKQGKYFIRSQDNGEDNCGFKSYYDGEETYSYSIFAKGKQFASPGKISISNNLSETSGVLSETLSGEANEYIRDNYRKDMDCSSEPAGCVLPIEFSSSYFNSQEIEINNLSVDMISSEGTDPNPEDAQFFDLNKTEAKITSDNLLINLDPLEFSLPSDYGNKQVSLELSDSEIFNENISIERVPELNFVYPVSVPLAYPQEFFLNYSLAENSSIEEVKWDFGDNNSKTNSNNSVEHSYEETGSYDIKVSLKDSKGRVSEKNFSVKVIPPIEFLENFFDEKKEILEGLKSDLEDMDGFYADRLERVIDVRKIESNLTSMEETFEMRQDSEKHLRELVEASLEYSFPEDISKRTISDSDKYVSSENDVNFELLNEVGSTIDSTEEEKYKNAILLWQAEEVDINVKLREFLVSGLNSFEERSHALTAGEISVNELSDDLNDYYIFLKDLEDMNFKKDYREKKTEGYYRINSEHLNNNEKIVFSTSEEIELEDIKIFVSPEKRYLDVSESKNFEEYKEEYPWGWLVFFILLIILLGLGLYTFLQEWYKKEYEKKLFKKGQLKTLLGYIRASKNKGIKEEKIEKNLKKAGWNSEQISFAIKKSKGERTGLPEIIPVEKIKNLFRNSSDKNNKKQKSLKGSSLLGNKGLPKDSPLNSGVFSKKK